MIWRRMAGAVGTGSIWTLWIRSASCERFAGSPELQEYTP